MTRASRHLPAFAFAFALLVVFAVPVTAHSDLDSSEPADGARLATSPQQVVLSFTGPIESAASSVVVTDGNGSRIDLDDLRTEGAGRQPVLTIGLQPDLPDGGYLVTWKILSDDGHPNSGEFGFAVGNGTAPPEASGASRLDSGSVAGRALSYLGLALAFGAAAWRWAVRAEARSVGSDGLARSASRVLLLGATLHALGAALLLKATLDSTGLPLGVLASSLVGRALVLRLVAGLAALVLAGLAIVPGNPSRLGTPAAVALLVVAAVASASIGHAAGEGLSGVLVDAVHLLASATWVGGLVLLLVALVLAHRQGLPADGVRRIGLAFGTVALTCVIVLLLSGVTTTLLILGGTAVLDPLHLAESLYGRLLLAKVVLAGLMVALAAANRFVFLGPAGPAAEGGRLRRRMAALGPDGTAKGLRRTVFVEAALGLAVLVLAGFLTATSPTDHEDHGDGVHDHGAALEHLHPLAARGSPDRGAMDSRPTVGPAAQGSPDVAPGLAGKPPR